MRELKFRAWNGKKIIDLYAVTPFAISEGLGIDGLFIPFKEEYKIMQFTGRPDKNGKDIYEGDILRKCYGSSVPVFAVAWSNERMTYIQNDGYNSPLYEIPYDMLEVIGNIYENPNLLSNE